MHGAIFFVVCISTNGSNVTFNVVVWLSFLSVKFSSQRSTFSEEFLNVKYVKKVEKGFLHTAVDYKGDAAASEAELRHDSDCLEQFTLSSAWNQKEKTSNLLLCKKS